jgi:hypothetical protein
MRKVSDKQIFNKTMVDVSFSELFNHFQKVEKNFK